jgi:1-deoxy-D-xylulose-5-phosphate synthase
MVSRPTLLDTINRPADLRSLSYEELARLAGEIRGFLVAAVSRTGGHLGPNLGVVELTLALHRVFESPDDSILWDTGHQAYVHKIITGRRDEFGLLRKKNGLSGYPNRAESVHDVIENSHASTGLSYADGLAKAHQLLSRTDRHVVVVVGDGALTGGMSFEALNNIAAAKDRQVIIVVNDNKRSYSPTIGGLANHLARLRTGRQYEGFLAWGKKTLLAVPGAGWPMFRMLHGAKTGLKDMIVPETLFDHLGLKYIGPIDGHDVAAMEASLAVAKDFPGPVVVHCRTIKGQGYRPAEEDETERRHAIGVCDPVTGAPLSAPTRTWTSVFSEEMLKIGVERDDVVAITAAMLHPVGLGDFALAHPDRIFDVGIAEQHAVTSAAGMALGGLHPVVAVYSTFLNRAFDQVLMDCALHRCGVTFVLDRAGVTGDDGASHNGMWDSSILHLVPGLRLAAPRDAATLRLSLREATGIADSPTAIRFPKGQVGDDILAIGRRGGVDILRCSDGNADSGDVLLIAVGAMAGPCLAAAEQLAGHGVSATVVDPRWVKPVDPALFALAAGHDLTVTVEDSGRVGGTGAATILAMNDAGVHVPFLTIGIAQRFLDHGSRQEILAEIGLNADDITGQVLSRLSPEVSPAQLAG